MDAPENEGVCGDSMDDDWLVSTVLRPSSLNKNLIPTQQQERCLWDVRLIITCVLNALYSLFLLKEMPKSGILFDLLSSHPTTWPSSFPTQMGGASHSPPQARGPGCSWPIRSGPSPSTAVKKEMTLQSLFTSIFFYNNACINFSLHLLSEVLLLPFPMVETFDL